MQLIIFFRALSKYYIYTYYWYNMFVVHRVVNGHSIPLYRYLKHFFRMYFAKNIVCNTQLDPFWDSSDVLRPRLHLTRTIVTRMDTTRPEYIDPRSKTRVLASTNKIYYFPYRYEFEFFTFSSWMRRYWFYVINDFRNFHQIFTFWDLLSQKKGFLRKCLSVCSRSCAA